MKTIDVKLISTSYQLFIERGIVKNIGERIKEIYHGNKIAIITDENVDGFYGKLIEQQLGKEGFTLVKIVMKPGEKTKTMESLQFLYDKLLDFGINRGSLIIALGGGVIGDLAGFCAATFMRGISYIQIPTSLLAQIDSSIGGKVAVDHEKGKNLIGSFYHPKAVFIDPDVLFTLDKRYICDGMGEVIKYGLIKDKELYEMLVKLQDYDDFMRHADEIIYRCCTIKRDVIEKDEKDMNLRIMLNFGHTLGHAIEKVKNYEGITHGEAVAVGMYNITCASEKIGITSVGTAQRVKEILKKFQLPYLMDEDKGDIERAILMDKKNMNDKISLIFISDIGESLIKKVPAAEVGKYVFNTVEGK